MSFALTNLSAPCVNLFVWAVKDTAGVATDGNEQTPLVIDSFQLEVSGVKLIDPPMTRQESTLEQSRTFLTSCYSGTPDAAEENIMLFSFALPGYADKASASAGSFSFRSAINPTVNLWMSNGSHQLEQPIVVRVVSQCMSLWNISGPYGSQKIEAATSTMY
jgi:hypothetical protein